MRYSFDATGNAATMRALTVGGLAQPARAVTERQTLYASSTSRLPRTRWDAWRRVATHELGAPDPTLCAPSVGPPARYQPAGPEPS